MRDKAMKIRTRKRDRKVAAAVMALGAFAAYNTSSARAEDTQEEIRLLKHRLKQLEQRVSEQAKETKKVKQATAQPAPPPSEPGYGVPITVGVPPQPLPGGLTGIETAERGLPVVGPSTLLFKGVSITPGGYLALDSLTRSRFIGTDITTPFGNIPYDNVPSSHSSEFRFSGRPSRFSLLVQGDVDPYTHLAGYGEADFEGDAQTGNSNESNSYNPRLRHAYLTADQDIYGVHLLAGQTWSLATMNTKGILPRQEDIPLTIDIQYVAGFVWTRQPQLRIVKDFDKNLWFALSLENPTTTTGGTAPTLPDGGAIVTGVNANVPAPTFPQTGVVGSSLFNNVNAINFTTMPDIIGKVAWEPTIFDRTIHMEAFGIFRQFSDRTIYPIGTAAFPYGTPFQNQNTYATGDGVGGSILLPVLPKVVDLQFSGLTGRGIGRYGSSQLPDVTFNSNGSLAPLTQTMLLAGAVWHAFPELDIYAYAGEEYQNAHWNFNFASPFAANGYGNPDFVNIGCNTEFYGTGTGLTACAGNTQLVREGTIGFWDNIYKGPFGRLAGGLQYAYVQKYSFNGIGGVAKANENEFFTSLRYYPF